MSNLLNSLAKKMVKKDCQDLGTGNGRLKELRKLTEQLSDNSREINRLETEYRNMVENATDVIMLTRPDGSIAYISKNCIDLLGYEYSELVNTIPCIIHPDDNFRIREHFNQALSGKSGTEIKYKIVTKTGETKEISHSWVPIFVNSKLYLVTSVLKSVT